MQKQYFNQLVPSLSPEEVAYYRAINWNEVDNVDKLTWDKLNSQFWLDTRIPVSNDLDDWRNFSDVERTTINRAFAGLTILDTLQSEEGAKKVREGATTQHEIAILNQIQFMEAVHAKSYSTIFITLNNTNQINEIFKWGNTNKQLQEKARLINEIYQEGNLYKIRIASVLLESFLFYSGFYPALRFLGENKIPNVAEIIKLILRDESVHGTYIGAKFQAQYDKLRTSEQEEIKQWAYDTVYALYEIEEVYTKEIYDEIGWTKDVLTFVRYNANKALMNLGFEALFSETAADVNPVVMNGISTSTANHDFFSQVGSGYLMGQVEAMTDEDYDY